MLTAPVGGGVEAGAAGDGDGVTCAGTAAVWLVGSALWTMALPPQPASAMVPARIPANVKFLNCRLKLVNETQDWRNCIMTVLYFLF